MAATDLGAVSATGTVSTNVLSYVVNAAVPKGSLVTWGVSCRWVSTWTTGGSVASYTDPRGNTWVTYLGQRGNTYAQLGGYAIINTALVSGDTLTFTIGTGNIPTTTNPIYGTLRAFSPGAGFKFTPQLSTAFIQQPTAEGTSTATHAIGYSEVTPDAGQTQFDLAIGYIGVEANSTTISSGTGGSNSYTGVVTYTNSTVRYMRLIMKTAAALTQNSGITTSAAANGKGMGAAFYVVPISGSATINSPVVRVVSAVGKKTATNSGNTHPAVRVYSASGSSKKATNSSNTHPAVRVYGAGKKTLSRSSNTHPAIRVYGATGKKTAVGSGICRVGITVRGSGKKFTLSASTIHVPVRVYGSGKKAISKASNTHPAIRVLSSGKKVVSGSSNTHPAIRVYGAGARAGGTGASLCHVPIRVYGSGKKIGKNASIIHVPVRVSGAGMKKMSSQGMVSSPVVRVKSAAGSKKITTNASKIVVPVRVRAAGLKKSSAAAKTIPVVRVRGAGTNASAHGASLCHFPVRVVKNGRKTGIGPALVGGGLNLSDPFTRVDATTLGSNWTVPVGSYSIAGNRANSNAAVYSIALYATPLTTAAQQVGFDIVASTGSSIGVVALSDSAGTSFYVARLNYSGGASAIGIYRITPSGGTVNLAPDVNVTRLSGATLNFIAYVNADGNVALSASYNGTTVNGLDVSVDKLTTGRYVGMRVGNVTGLAVDNWTASDTTIPGTSRAKIAIKVFGVSARPRGGAAVCHFPVRVRSAGKKIVTGAGATHPLIRVKSSGKKFVSGSGTTHPAIRVLSASRPKNAKGGSAAHLGLHTLGGTGKKKGTNKAKTLINIYAPGKYLAPKVYRAASNFYFAQIDKHSPNSLGVLSQALYPSGTLYPSSSLFPGSSAIESGGGADTALYPGNTLYPGGTVYPSGQVVFEVNLNYHPLCAGSPGAKEVTGFNSLGSFTAKTKNYSMEMFFLPLAMTTKTIIMGHTEGDGLYFDGTNLTFTVKFAHAPSVNVVYPLPKEINYIMATVTGERANLYVGGELVASQEFTIEQQVDDYYNFNDTTIVTGADNQIFAIDQVSVYPYEVPAEIVRNHFLISRYNKNIYGAVDDFTWSDENFRYDVDSSFPGWPGSVVDIARTDILTAKAGGVYKTAVFTSDATNSVGSRISWQGTGTFTVKTSLDGTNWYSATNGDAVPYVEGATEATVVYVMVTFTTAGTLSKLRVTVYRDGVSIGPSRQLTGEIVPSEVRFDPQVMGVGGQGAGLFSAGGSYKTVEIWYKKGANGYIYDNGTQHIYLDEDGNMAHNMTALYINAYLDVLDGWNYVVGTLSAASTGVFAVGSQMNGSTPLGGYIGKVGTYPDAFTEEKAVDFYNGYFMQDKIAIIDSGVSIFEHEATADVYDWTTLSV